MKPQRSPFLIAALFAASPALAANTVVIHQVGGGSSSVSVQQSGKGNKTVVNMKQLPADAKEQSPKALDESEVEPKEKPKADFQQKVLTDPYITERARAQELIGRNSIVIKQQGGENKVDTYQEGARNELLVEQDGEKNSVSHDQQGESSDYKIIQNGEIIEDSTKP